MSTARPEMPEAPRSSPRVGRNLDGIPYWGLATQTASDMCRIRLSTWRSTVETGFTFAVPYDGSYNPAFLTAVEGGSNFALLWSAPYNVSVKA
jgi:hypothetical protein